MFSDLKKLMKDFMAGKKLDRPKDIMDLAEEIVNQPPPPKETTEEWAERLSKDLAEFSD